MKTIIEKSIVSQAYAKPQEVWIMKSLSTLVVLVVGALLCGSAPASAAIIFEDNFEGHPVGTLLSAAVTPPIGASYEGSTYGEIIAGLGTNTSQCVGPRENNLAAVDWLNISAANQTAAENQVVGFSLDLYVTKVDGCDAGVSISTFKTQSWYGRGFSVRAGYRLAQHLLPELVT